MCLYHWIAHEEKPEINTMNDILGVARQGVDDILAFIDKEGYVVVKKEIDPKKYHSQFCECHHCEREKHLGGGN